MEAIEQYFPVMVDLTYIVWGENRRVLGNRAGPVNRANMKGPLIPAQTASAINLQLSAFSYVVPSSLWMDTFQRSEMNQRAWATQACRT